MVSCGGLRGRVMQLRRIDEMPCLLRLRVSCEGDYALSVRPRFSFFLDLVEARVTVVECGTLSRLVQDFRSVRLGSRGLFLSELVLLI